MTRRFATEFFGNHQIFLIFHNLALYSTLLFCRFSNSPVSFLVVLRLVVCVYARNKRYVQVTTVYASMPRWMFVVCLPVRIIHASILRIRWQLLHRTQIYHITLYTTTCLPRPYMATYYDGMYAVFCHALLSDCVVCVS